MIVDSLLGLISSFLSLLLAPITIPALPEGVASLLQQAAVYFGDGLGIFAAFTHFNFIMTLFGIVVLIDAAMLVYKFIVWLLKKIPMASIE